MADTSLTNRAKNVLPAAPELFEVGERVAGLVASQAWEDVQRVLDAEIDVIDQQLEATGPEPLSQARYAQLLGRRGGLRAARDVAGVIVRHADETLVKEQAKADGESSGNR